MKNSTFSKLVGCALSVVTLSLSNLAYAEVKVSFTEAKKFSDYELTSYSRKKSLSKLQTDLTKLFESVAKESNIEDKQLIIKVSNIDLPGTMKYAQGPNHNDIRVVDNNTPFRLYFSYQLKSTSGQIETEGEHKLKEYPDSRTMLARNRNKTSVGYYEEHLENWAKATFK